MPIHIEDIFKEIIKYYYVSYYILPDGIHLMNINNYLDNKYRHYLNQEYETLYKNIPTIVNFNRISKIHYQWTKNITDNCRIPNRIHEIKNSLIWLNAQRLIKTINKKSVKYEHFVKLCINVKISDISFEYAVFLYNKLNTIKIIGKYPYYNIGRKYILPGEFERLKKGNPKWDRYYKKFYQNIL